MSRPILLWSPHKSIASDDACTNIVKYTLPPAPTQGTYSHQSRPQLSYVPSLMYFCIQKLIDYPDHFHVLGPARIHYRRDPSPQVFDILRALIPSYDPSETLDLSIVDPRLWALLVQVYTGLPDAFRTYTIPLSDAHLPLLQQIPMTQDFALLTVVALPGCKDLRDDTILEFKALHGLCALDASGTELSAWGIRNLAKTLVTEETYESGSRRMKGPWGLRILRLRNCVNVKDDIFEHLTLFPLLSVVDLRDTQCMKRIHPGPFRPNNCVSLFHPTPLLDVLDYISALAARDSIQIYSHPVPFILSVNTLHHKHPSTRNNVRLFPGRPPRYHSSVMQSQLQPAVPRNEQELAAMEEVHLHNSRRAAEAFYAPPPPPVRPPSMAAPAQSRDIRRTLPSFGEVEYSFLPPHRDALTLFRKPPPWSTLEAIQREKPERVHVQKRRRTDGDIAEAARKEGKGEVKAVWDMISRRMSEMGGKRGGRDTDGKVRTHSTSESFPSKNPFLRDKSSRSTLTHNSSGDVPAERSTTSRLTIVRAESSLTHGSSNACSNMAVPPWANKPLLPISSLTIPVLPPSLLKKNIPPNTKIRARKSVDGGKQMVLPAVKRCKSAAEMRKESSLKSRQADIRRFSNGNAGGSGKDTIETKGRSEGKGTKFDWSRWSGG